MERIWGTKQRWGRGWGKNPIPEYNRGGDGDNIPRLDPVPYYILYMYIFFVLNIFVKLFIENFHENYSKTCFCDVGNKAWIVFDLFIMLLLDFVFVLVY